MYRASYVDDYYYNFQKVINQSMAIERQKQKNENIFFSRDDVDRLLDDAKSDYRQNKVSQPKEYRIRLFKPKGDEYVSSGYFYAYYKVLNDEHCDVGSQNVDDSKKHNKPPKDGGRDDGDDGTNPPPTKKPDDGDDGRDGKDGKKGDDGDDGKGGDGKDGKGAEPHWCKTTDLTKEACEYFDWVDDEPEPKEDKKIEVEDEEEQPLKDDVIDVDRDCPPNQQIQITMPWGYATTVEFDYKPYCDFAVQINPYVTAMGFLLSFYIVTGVRKF